MHLTKHHGLANDFLVVLAERGDGAASVDGALARALCHRRTGIGADGLLWGQAPAGGTEGVDLVMHLYNSDGSRAEMSGNGIRCLAQALAMARGDGAGATYRIATDGGIRTVALRSVDGAVVTAAVDMGSVRPGPAVPEPLGERLDGRHGTVDLGNPHLVIEVADPHAVDLETEGPWLEQQFPGGINVEYIHAASPDHLDLRVWERGAGITAACGTGACAAAHLANRWDLVGTNVTVTMPGGDAQIELRGDGITLIGPSTYVADIEVPDG